MDIESMDKILSIVANFLTAGGILGFIYWWTNKSFVRIYMRVPDYKNVNWKMLYIRDGGEGTNIENKVMKFREYKSKNPGESIVGIKVKSNPRLGFQFKCFAEFTGTDKQNENLYPEFKTHMEKMGFHQVEGMAYDGKVWFLIPEEYKLGKIKASPVENIINNIWYPTLSKTIYPYMSISARVPLKAGETDLFSNVDFYIESFTRKKERKRYYFDVVEKSEAENCALIKASVKITSEFNPFRFKVYMHPRASVDTKLIRDKLCYITDNNKEEVRQNLMDAITEFRTLLKEYQTKSAESDGPDEDVIQVKAVYEALNERKESHFPQNDVVRAAESDMESFLKDNFNRKSLRDQAREIQDILHAFDYDYTIRAANSDPDQRIEILLDENTGFFRNESDDTYLWKPGIKKGGLLKTLKPE
jgi:hypothetical protein